MLPVLLFALFAGVIGGGVFYMTREPVNVVKAQLDELGRGDFDAAYARLSAGHRSRLSREAFAQLVEKHPVLRDNADATFWNRSLHNEDARLSGTLTSRSGVKETVAFELVQEGGSWRIDSIRFGADARDR